VLAVCQQVAGGDCRGVESDSGINPMIPYTFKTTLIAGRSPSYIL
jgi:hypothetical protein